MTNQTIHLQSIGAVPAVPVSEVEAGDSIMWNFGIVSEVASNEQATPKTFELVERDEKGQTYSRHMRGTTLVARMRDGVFA